MPIKKDDAAPMAAYRLAGSRKFIAFAVLLVFATLPHLSHEFAFNFGGDGDADDNAENDGKKAPIRRPIAKKFKFHKIERVYNEDEDTDGEENDEDTNGVAKNIKSAAREEEEEAEIEFERARKVQKSKQKKEKKKSSEQDEDVEETTNFFGMVFSFLSFGNKEKKKVKITAEAPSANGIIDWIMWLGEKTGRINPPETPPPPPIKFKSNADEGWHSYLNRWPFNTIFPFGKPAKPIAMPRQMGNDRGRSSQKTSSLMDEEEPPMSEAHFENLLHSLPAFVLNAKHVSVDDDCRQQIQIFQRQLRAKKLWTLQLLDASGKISSGLLRGNINQFGDFDLCTHVKAVIKLAPEMPLRIRGKYCLAHIELATDAPDLKAPIHLIQGRGLVNSHLGNPSHFLARYSIANWGICMPSVCPPSAVQEMLERNLAPYNRTGIEFHIEVDDNDCAVRPVKRLMKLLNKDQKFAGTVSVIVLHIILVVTALAFDYSSLFKALLKTIQQFQKRNNEENGEESKVKQSGDSVEQPNDNTNDKSNDEEQPVLEESHEKAENVQAAPSKLQQLLLDVLLKYSPKRTLSNLLSQERLEFPIFHLIKLSSTLMLYVCLKFLMIGHLPISNRDKLVKFLEQPMSIFIRSPIFYADALLILSGFTVAYQLSEEMAEKRYIQLLKRLTAKVARYLPTMFLVLAFQTWILPYLGTGPLWGNLVGQHAQLCEQQMWRNAFGAQNAIDFEDTCSPMTVQVALQIQLFLLAPLIVWLYYTDPDAVFFVYGALHAFSVAARYSRTNREHLSMTMFHGINVSKFYRSANLLYSSPIARATPYLLGIGAGLLYRTQKGTLEILGHLIPFGWGMCALSLLWCFWSPSASMNTDFVYNASDAAAYAAWSPMISGLAFCWLIFMFPKSENSLLKFVCNTRPVLFLSRISYPMQLVTFVVVLQSTASVHETIKFHITDLFDINEIGAILFYATIVAFIVDIPIQQIRHILVDRLFMERAALQVEESESEEAAPQREDTAAASAESIWSSDPEEEEGKYIERRRSSLTENAVEEFAANAKNEEGNDTKKKSGSDDEVEEQEEEEDEDETEVAEEAEVKKRP